MDLTLSHFCHLSFPSGHTEALFSLKSGGRPAVWLIERQVLWEGKGSACLMTFDLRALGVPCVGGALSPGSLHFKMHPHPHFRRAAGGSVLATAHWCPALRSVAESSLSLSLSGSKRPEDPSPLPCPECVHVVVWMNPS